MITDQYEAGVLTKLLLDNSAIPLCDLTPEDFTNIQYAAIYDAISVLDNRGEMVDIITVCDYLTAKNNYNWLPILAGITKDSSCPSDITTYAKAVRKGRQTQTFKQLGTELAERGNEEGAADEIIGKLMNVTRPETRFDFNASSALKIAVHELDEIFTNGKKAGISTGLVEIDEKLGGLHSGDLVIIGARPAMGKTAFLLNLAIGIASNGVSVGVFSGEQGAPQIMQRMISMRGSIPVSRMRNGQMVEEDWSKLSVSVRTIKDWDIQIYDKPAPTATEIVRKARQWQHSHNVGVIFIDYLQRIKVDSNTARNEAVGEVARTLKELARDLDIPVVCLAQVNRSVESRNDKRPRMGDLKDSGDIEQEADQVMMLYRDEVYNEDTPEKGVAEILLDKNRHGPTGRIRTIWRGEYMRFENMKRPE